MICKCGGIYDIMRVEDLKYPLYNRVCDVQCLNCGDIRYSQPYDFGKRINEVRKIDRD